jgi:hypothetical protein
MFRKTRIGMALAPWIGTAWVLVLGCTGYKLTTVSSAAGAGAGESVRGTTGMRGGSSGQGATTAGAGAAGGASESTDGSLQISFARMYSGYDGSHVFKIPARVSGASVVKWSSSDSSYVDLDDLDPTAGSGGVMITTKRAGTVQIIARSGHLAGSATLTITAYDSADCDAGDLRYNVTVGTDGGTGKDGPQAIGDALPKRVACVACHGDEPKYLTVRHTPMQTGGWTDDELQQTFSDGFIPDGSVFATPFPRETYQRVHQWSVTKQEKVGLVCYMRSITPASHGTLDFPQ